MIWFSGLPLIDLSETFSTYFTMMETILCFVSYTKDQILAYRKILTEIALYAGFFFFNKLVLQRRTN